MDCVALALSVITISAVGGLEMEKAFVVSELRYIFLQRVTIVCPRDAVMRLGLANSVNVVHFRHVP